MYFSGRLSQDSRRAFGGPFGGNGCSNFFPPFGFSCTSDDGTTTSATETETKTKMATPAPQPPQTTVITSATVVTSVAVVTSGDTITVGTTFTSGSTVTSLITPTLAHTSTFTALSTLDTALLSGTSSPPATPAGTQISIIRSGSNTNIYATTQSEPIESTSGADVIHSIETTTVASTSSPTAAIAGQVTRHMNPGEIVAICVACVSLLTLCVIIWRAWRRRRQSNRAATSSGLPDADRTTHSLHANDMSPTSNHPSNASILHQHPRLPSGGFDDIREKPEDTFRYSDGAASGLSPTSSSLFSPTSPTPLLPARALSSGRVPSTVAESGAVPGSRFRGAWDDPPPTPHACPASPATSEGPAYPRSHGGHGYLTATTENYHPSRNTAYSKSILFGSHGASEVDLGTLPEYSRY
ncbi:hypothetical protein C8Q79DRAFT_334606 [Trametes meyenii]|nr:hypothetical protein C8Q79DRAFT_334606 [Trametes meyenii]